MGFRNRENSAPEEAKRTFSPSDFSPVRPASRDEESTLDLETEIIEKLGTVHQFRSDAPVVKPKLRRRLVDEPQDTFTTQVRRSTLDKFDEWCAIHGYSKKAGFDEMVRRVTRRSSDPSR